MARIYTSKISKDYLIVNYCNLRKSCTEIAKDLNMSRSAVYCRTRKYKINRSPSEAKKNDLNPMWNPDVKYGAIHDWVRRRKTKPSKCESCSNDTPRDLANISGEYKRDVNDFEWLCRKCHMQKDGRLNNLKQYQVV